MGLNEKNLSQKPADFSGGESIWPKVGVYVWVNLKESLCWNHAISDEEKWSDN